MIKAFCGQVGEGKTLSMVNEVLPFLKHGYRLVTNTPFSRRGIKFNSFSEIIKLKPPFCVTHTEPILLDSIESFFADFKTGKNTIYCLDEAEIWLENYSWEKVDKRIYTRFYQNRKLHIHLLYTTQYFKFVVPKLRSMTNEVVECSVPFRRPFFKPKVWDAYIKAPPLCVMQIKYKPTFYEQSSYSIEIEKKYIMGRNLLWGDNLTNAMRSFNTEFFVKDTDAGL
jgi:hypothetical protein